MRRLPYRLRATGYGLAIKAVLGLFALAASLTACSETDERSGTGRLRPCRSDEGPADSSCGTLSVFENRDAKSGRRLDLFIVVLGANGANARPDPVFFLAGGPGQAAAKMAPELSAFLRGIQRTRDIVLVDQRGTGRSNGLECRHESDSLTAVNESDEQSLARVRACLDGYKADVRFYTTSIAMDDLDDVRAYLGYDRINLFGVSYGTRAALEYVRRHRDHVRAVILDSVAPSDMRLPLYTSRDASRALQRVLDDCASDRSCNAAYPGLADRVRALLRRLDAHPPRVTLTHPRTGATEEITVEARLVAGIVFSALYSPLTASMLPAVIDRAERDDFQSLLALGLAGEGTSENMSVGMRLSVLCSEDATRFNAEDAERASSGSYFGGHLARGQLEPCAFWPKGEVEPAYFEPVTSDAPTLILSGDHDPVTPPVWGESVAKHLPRSKHVVVPASGHGVMTTPCGLRLIEAFLDAGNADNLNVKCAAETRRPPFVVSPAGPDPAPAAGAAK